MILQCPKCNARYLVPDYAVGADGRMVRCAKCSHSWFAKAPDAIIAVPSDNATPDLEAMIESINAGEKIAVKPLAAGSNLPVYHRPRTPVSLKIAVAVVGALVVFLALFIYMPKLFGVRNSNGIVLTDIKMDKQAGDKYGIVEISGNIKNDNEQDNIVPNLRVILLDEKNNPLQSWELDGGGKPLKAKEEIPFAASNLAIKFSSAKRFVVDLGTPLELLLRRRPENTVSLEVVPTAAPAGPITATTPTDSVPATTTPATTAPDVAPAPTPEPSPEEKTK